MTDPIADMLTRIRNSQAADKETAEIPFSRLKYALAKILEQQGAVHSAEFRGRGTKKSIVVRLKYKDGRPVISRLVRISKPGQRVYAGAENIGKAKRGYGWSILSTSRGLMTERDALKQKVGGEIICRIW